MNAVPPHALEPTLLATLRRALHPVATPPVCESLNLAEIADLLDDLREPAKAAVLVAIVAYERTPTLLLTRRNDALRNHGGQISFPGGRVEPQDASIVAAALRESHEEIGLEPESVEVLGYLDPLTTITGFDVVPVVALVAPGVALAPDPNEVAALFDVPLAFVLDPANHELRSREFMGRVRRYHAITCDGHEIWGATAAMIVNLSQRLRDAGWSP